MKFVKSFELRKVGNESVLVQTESSEVNMGRVISLNESALLVFGYFRDKTFTLSDIRDFLLENYDVDFSVAEKDAEELTDSLLGAGIIVG